MIHRGILQTPMRIVGNQPELEHGLPPANGRTVRKDKPMAGTIPLDLREHQSRRLEPVVTNGPIHTQLVAQQNYKENTV